MITTAALTFPVFGHPLPGHQGQSRTARNAATVTCSNTFRVTIYNCRIPVRVNGRVMLGTVRAKRSLPSSEEHRRDAIIAFLGAGLHQPVSTALARGRSGERPASFAARLARGASAGEWLASATGVAGLREHAAVPPGQQPEAEQLLRPGGQAVTA